MQIAIISDLSFIAGSIRDSLGCAPSKEHFYSMENWSEVSESYDNSLSTYLNNRYCVPIYVLGFTYAHMFCYNSIERGFLIEKMNKDWFCLNLYFLRSLGKHNLRFKSQNRSWIRSKQSIVTGSNWPAENTHLISQ